MIGRLLVLLVLFSLSHYLSRVVDLDPVQDPPSSATPSGLRIVEFNYKEKLERLETRGSGSSTTRRPTLEPDLFPGPVVRNQEDITPSRDLTERMRELRQVSRPISSPPIFVPRFLFHAQMKNETAKTIKRFVWSYQPQADKGEIIGKDYVCNAQMQPATLQKFEVLSPIPGTRVVDASQAGKPDEPLRPSLTDLSIRFVEFEDGSSWQDPAWNSTSLLTRLGTRKLGQGKCTVL